MLRRLVLTLAVAALATPAPAGASFPGSNGRLVLVIQGCDSSSYLATMPWEGGAFAPLTRECEPDFSYRDVVSADASADGNRVISALRDGSGNPSVVVFSSDGTSQEIVPLTQRHAYASSLSFTPDGKRFVFEDDAVREASLDGSSLRRITAACPVGNCVSFERPELSPDGRLIAVDVVRRGNVPRRPRPPRPGVWLIRASNGDLVRRLAPSGVDVTWAPGGKRLAYATPFGRDTEGDNQATGGRLYVVRRDGTNRRLLGRRRNVAAVSPAWSPDRRWIVWTSLRFAGEGDVSFDVKSSLWRMRSRGGGAIRVKRLPPPQVDEGEIDVPEVAWLPRPTSPRR